MYRFDFPAMTDSLRDAAKQGLAHLFTLFKWIVMGTISGCIVGLVGSLFALTLSFANGFRARQPYVALLLPAAGLIIVFLYRFFRNTDDTGTNMVIASIHSGTAISYKMAPLIFVSTVLTHLCGGSSGREGAAIQLGGSITNFLSEIPFLRFTPNDHKLNIMCGMSAGFAALFGTPLAAAFFSLEVISVGIMHYSALVPCIIAAYAARFIASAFGIPAESFTVLSIPAITPLTLVKLLLFGLVIGWISVFFCKSLHAAETLNRKCFPNPYLRIAVSGCIILLLCLILGTDRYLGSGIHIIETIFEENAPAELPVFLLKILFTALTLGAGFKGGEIVPSFCVGAAFGSLAASLMGLPVTLCAACGMVGLFCGVTNCPISSLLIAFEMFGFEGMPYYLFTIAVSYALSGYYGLYHSQRIMYSKTQPQFINTNAQ